MFLFQMANLVITPQLSARLVPLFRKNVFFIRFPLHFSQSQKMLARENLPPALLVALIQTLRSKINNSRT